MNKRKFMFVLLIICILVPSSISYAFVDSSNAIVTPDSEPCYLYGNHIYDNSYQQNFHSKQYTHTHFVYDDLGGVIDIYDDWYCSIYRLRQVWCDCGNYLENSYTYQYSHCEPL